MGRHTLLALRGKILNDLPSVRDPLKEQAKGENNPRQRSSIRTWRPIGGGSLCAPPLHRRSVSCAAILKAKAWRSSCVRALGSVAHCQASATAIAFERSSGAGGGNGSQSHCSRPWGLRWLGPCRCCYHWRSPLHACAQSMRWSRIYRWEIYFRARRTSET